MKHIYVGTSAISGRGVCIVENIKKGETIAFIKGKMKFKVNEGPEDTFSNPDWVGITKNQWIDPEKPYKFLNHSCNPSASIKGRVTLVALRDIKEGEEITIDYSITECDDLWEMKCACGEKNCRKVVHPIQRLPEKQFKKYLPYIPTYFRDLYFRTHRNIVLAKS